MMATVGVRILVRKNAIRHRGLNILSCAMTHARRIEAHAGTIPSSILLAFCCLNVGRHSAHVNQRNTVRV
jgi:hypothetical protein